MSERVKMQPAQPDPQLVRLEAIIGKQQQSLGQLHTSIAVLQTDLENATGYARSLEEAVKLRDQTNSALEAKLRESNEMLEAARQHIGKLTSRTLAPDLLEGLPVASVAGAGLLELLADDPAQWVGATVAPEPVTPDA